MKGFLLLTVLLGTLLLGACGPSATVMTAPEPATLTVFAAASLTDAFNEIGANLEAANPGLEITFNFGGSQTLRTQIEEGAPADVFASANQKEMDAMVAGSFVNADHVEKFISNRLIVIMPADNPAGLESLADLAKPGVKLVLAAQEVPVGNYTLQVFDKLNVSLEAGFKDKALANVVSYENDVRQVVAKVQLGEADAGVVYGSDAVAVLALEKIDIPVAENIVALYPMAALEQSANGELAQAFIDYALSDEGQAILQKWGFLPVEHRARP